MDDAVPLFRRLTRWASHPIALGLIATHGVFAVLVVLRLLGWLQEAELQMHDRLTRHWAGSEKALVDGSVPIALIGATEEDLNRYGWPLSDATLADAIDAVFAAGATVLGIDIYRDRPRPPGEYELREAYAAYENLVLIYLEGTNEGFTIPPPPDLVGTPKLGFADIVRDLDGSVRRALVYVQSSDGGGPRFSFPFVIAFRHLQHLGVPVGGNPDDPSQLMVGPTPLRPFEENDGGYIHADAGGYQVRLDYRDGSDAFPTFSLSALLDGTLAPDALRGRAVVLGTTAHSVKDDFITPLTSPSGVAGANFGIEVHAHAIAQFIRQGLGVSPGGDVLSPVAEFLWIWIWCLVGGLVLAGISRLLVAAALVGVAGVALTVIVVQSFGAHVWLPFLPALVGLTVSGGVSAAILNYLERAQRRALMGMFSQHVSPDVAKALWRQRDAFTESGRPSSREVTATILFTDLRGFSTVSETMSPGELTDWLNEYMGAMSDIVAEHGGIVDKFIGDAVMAVFGVPVARTSQEEIDRDAVNAVECAMAMGERLELLNARWRDEGRPEIGMRVGLCTGPVVAGALGGQQRLSYTVIGDIVNTASRLESYDKTVADDRVCRVLVAESTLRRLGDRFRATRIGEVTLKGKSESTITYLVDGRLSH